MSSSSNNLPPHVEETVRAIADLHEKHDQRSTRAERIVERVTADIGRPGFLAALTVVVVVWISGNLLAAHAYGTAWDRPPFSLLQGGLQVLAVYMAVLILTTQRRADELADLREQMTLELSVLIERKTAKIIELLEEARRDSPYLHDRVDDEASEMSAQADPEAIIGAIEKTTKDLKTPKAK
jgi:uncharacterized membrane protein